MKALPLEQKQLLELQQVDLGRARILHQEKTHPALQTLSALQDRQQDLQRAIVATKVDLNDLSRQIKQIEDEIVKVQDRRKLQQDRLQEGKVPMRDMSAMEHEIARMDTRIEDLEGSVLELMDKSEKLEAAIVAAQTNAAAIAVDEEKAKANMGQDLLVSREQLQKLTQTRENLRELLPEEIVAEYDKLQQRLGTAVVIEVRDGYPVQAPVELSFAELSELNSFPADQLYISDETEYMVARTNS